jgi:hypothetical protein
MAFKQKVSNPIWQSRDNSTMVRPMVYIHPSLLLVGLVVVMIWVMHHRCRSSENNLAWKIQCPVFVPVDTTF